MKRIGLLVALAPLALTLGASAAIANPAQRKLDSRKCPTHFTVTVNGFRYLSFLDYLLNAEKKIAIDLTLVPKAAGFICDYAGIDHEGRPYEAYLMEEGIVPAKPQPGATNFPRLYVRSRFALQGEDPRTFLRFDTWISLREAPHRYEIVSSIEVPGDGSQLFYPTPEICMPEHQPPGCVWVPSLP